MVPAGMDCQAKRGELLFQLHATLVPGYGMPRRSLGCATEKKNVFGAFGCGERGGQDQCHTLGGGGGVLWLATKARPCFPPFGKEVL